MSKLHMRARKLDYSRRLHVYRAEEVLDLDDQAQFARSVPVVATGVEKEEEEEHHLQAFISASQVDGPRPTIYIPIPDASREVSDYDHFYKPDFQRPPRLVKLSTNNEDATNEYDLDDEDDAWLKEYNARAGAANSLSEDLLEQMIGKLEALILFDHASEPGYTPSADDLGPLGKHAAAAAVLDYWKSRRAALNHSLLTMLKPEVKLNDPDPFVCFRRRELRQTRKSRRNDQQSYERLQKLRTEMIRARELVDLTIRRDRMKKESLLLDVLIFEQKLRVWELKRKYLKANNLGEESLSSLDGPRPEKKKALLASPTKVRIKFGSYAKGSDHEGSTLHVASPAKPSAAGGLGPLSSDRRGADEGVPLADISTRFSEKFTGIDPGFQPLTLMSDLPFSSTRPEDDYVDLTDALSYELPEDTKPLPRLFRSLPLEPHHRLSFARRRVGRGGRIWIDRSSMQLSRLHDAKVDALRAASSAQTMSDPPPVEDEGVWDDASDVGRPGAVDDLVVPSSFFSMSLPCYTPQDLNVLNGMSELYQRDRQRLQGRQVTNPPSRPGPTPPGGPSGSAAQANAARGVGGRIVDAARSPAPAMMDFPRASSSSTGSSSSARKSSKSGSHRSLYGKDDRHKKKSKSGDRKGSHNGYLMAGGQDTPTRLPSSAASAMVSPIARTPKPGVRTVKPSPKVIANRAAGSPALGYGDH